MPKKKYIIYIIQLTLFALLAACSSEDSGEQTEGAMAHVTMNIATRATGTPESAANNAEKIHTWWVVFVNRAGNVQKIVQRPSSDSYVEEETVELDIPTGTYTLYAFANITQSAVTTAGYTFTEGSPKPAGIDAATWTLANGYSGDIPMTGRQNVTVTNRVNQTFSIEVVRMLAKMEFRYKNESTKALSINSLSIKQVQKTPVPLLPNYDWLTDGWTFADQGTEATTYTRTYSTPLAVALTASTTDTFYMIESQADYTAPSQSYLMTLNVTRNGNIDDLYFTLDKTSIQTIYRNDHVIVPLNISDFIVSLDAEFYPPIGGFPAIITTDNDKTEFYCTFATQGEFEIRPTVFNAATRTNVYYPHWDYNSTTVTVTGAPIFSTAPHIDPATGELLGTLNTTEGIACIDVEIKVEVSTGVYQLYPRRIYIIRKNS